MAFAPQATTTVFAQSRKAEVKDLCDLHLQAENSVE